MVELLRECDCAYLRDQYANGERLMMREGIGQPEVITASGRATCRLCGEKIKKGEQAIVFPFDWEGNAWTAIDMQIHLHQCQKK